MYTILGAISFAPKAIGKQVEYFSSQRNINNNYPFSNAVRVGDLLFSSCEIDTLPNSNKLVAGGIKNQTKQTIDNIAASLAKHSLSMDNLVKCTVMLADIKDWPAFNQVYKGYFPARNAFDTNGLAINSRVEMECIEAVKGQ